MADEQAERDLRNVLVLALADGQLSEGEKQFIESLRKRLAIGQEEFSQICEQIRRNPAQVLLPRGSPEAERAIRLLVEAAAADGHVSPPERKVLAALARRAGLDESFVDQAAAAARPGSQAALAALVEEVYARFAGWDGAVRRAKIEALAAASPDPAVTLLRMLESYRAPDGAADNLELKVLLAEQLGRLGDDRAVHYLSQQVAIGEMEDEITRAPLRQAAAEALGRILKQPFTRDQAGVQAARRWWFGGGLRKYDRLAF
jgi:tellurite resistance protein